MSDSDTETSSLKLVRFHGKRGEDYGLWRMRLRAACRVKGVWKVVESTSETTSQTTLASTSVQKDTQPSSAVAASEKQLDKLEKASAIIISALGDAPLRVVMEADDDPSKMLRLLDARYASSRTVSRIAVQTQLFRMSYKGQNMSSYIDQFTSLFSQLERMGKDAAIPETHKAPMLLASIDPNCSLESTAAALRTKEVSELTWDYVATTLIDEYNAREMSKPNGSVSSSKSKKKKKKSKSSNMSSSMESGHDAHSDDNDSDIEKTVQAFSAALKSSMGSKSSDSVKCGFCERRGHTEDRCFLNPDNPNNKLTPKMKAVMSNKGSKPTSGDSKLSGGNGKRKVELAGSFMEKTTVNAPKDYRTYADSGATSHCFFNEKVFVPGSLESCDDRTIEMADKSTVTSNAFGEVIISFELVNIRLQNVLYVPTMGYNLVSTGRLADNGIESLFRRNDFVLQLESDATTIGQGDRDSSSGLYVFPNQNLDITLNVSESEHNVSNTLLWHRRLAHINMQDLYNVHNHADGIPKLTPSQEECRACHLGKAHKLPFNSHFKPTSSIGEIVHSDIMGKLEISFPNRYRYVCPFIDGFSRYTFLGFLHKRSDLPEALELVQTKMASMSSDINFYSSSAIQQLHSDGAEEYKALENYFGGSGISKSFSPPYTPEHNAIAERINRTLGDAARSLLIQANLPTCLWPFALKHVVYVRNRVQHSAIGKSPFEVVNGERPDLKHIRVFGCTAYALRLPRQSKFASRAIEGVYLETAEHGIFKILIMEEDKIYRIIQSRHVTFDENKFLGAPYLEEIMEDEASDDDTDSNTTEDHSENGIEVTQFDDMSLQFENQNRSENNPISSNDNQLQVPQGNISNDSSPSNSSDEQDSQSGGDQDGNIDSDIHEDDEPRDDAPHDTEEDDQSADNRRYPSRNRNPPGKWYIASTAQHKSNEKIKITTSDDPTLSEIMNSTPEEQALWQAAIDDEFKSFKNKDTWTEDPNPKSQPLPTHMVFKIKRLSDGTVDRFRGRTVAGGNHQIFGENYFETYAPVVTFVLVRIFLYIALCLGMKRCQLDVKTAFLNGHLSVDIWVMSPRGIPGHPTRCYKLNKAIYGLKQAHLAWHKRLCSDLAQMGFEELPSAPCVFYLQNTEIGGDVYLLVYVDDILILSSTDDGIKYVVNSFKHLYEVRVSYDVELFLGVHMKWFQGSKAGLPQLFMSQPLYIEGILRRFGMTMCKPVATPMISTFWTGLSSEQDKSIMDVKRFEQIIGSLLYLALRSRPDILTSVLILARFQKAPTTYCHQAAKRILRYLRGTTTHGMMYESGNIKITGFVDSDYAGDVTDRKSMSGFIIKLGSASCIWGSKKQPTVALSTCEAEYHALTMSAKEIIWIRRVLQEVGFEVHNPTSMNSDNQCGIDWATSDKCPSTRAKHIDVQVHYIRDLCEEGTIDIPYVPSEDNDADIFTKPLDKIKHMTICKRIGLLESPEEEC